MQYDDFQVGYTGSYSNTITEEKNKKFGELTGDLNPIHFDEDRMKNTIFGKCATNGLFTETAIGSALVKMFTSDKTMIIALKQENLLLAPVFIGDTVTAIVTVEERFPEKQRLLCNCKVVKQDETIVIKSKFLVKILNA
jgi:acyl dehydratase